jgi:hypothetical protein
MKLRAPSAVETEIPGIRGIDTHDAADMAVAIDLILEAFESSTDREAVVETALHQARAMDNAERSLIVQELITQLGQTMDHAYWHRPHERFWRA